LLMEALPLFIGGSDCVPVSVIQSLFMALDPFLAERKFIRFAGLDMAGEAAKSFVALEDWINDGVPLARRVALECARSWYRDNDPARGAWQVAGRPVRPEAGSPEPIFQRPVFMGSGLAAARRHGMTGYFAVFVQSPVIARSGLHGWTSRRQRF